MNARLVKLIDTLKNGGIAVLRTDTLYGIVARAGDKAAVERVYRAKRRDPEKSCIILVGDASQVYGNPDEFRQDIMSAPDSPTSFLIESPHAPQWLLRANDMLAYRLPADGWLQEVLRQTGPLIAPSANPEGLPPACTVEEARKYFGDQVDYYLDDGEVPADTPPSRLVRIHTDGTIERLR